MCDAEPSSSNANCLLVGDVVLKATYSKHIYILSIKAIVWINA